MTPEKSTNTPSNSVTHSIVVPLFNEEKPLPALVAALRKFLATRSETWECILVDDGSSDGTKTMLTKLSSEEPVFRSLILSSNHGQAAALFTGLRAAKGNTLVTMDGDGQNDPADIPLLLDALAKGADLAVGIRANRQDSRGRILMSRLANRVRGRILGDRMTDSGCALKAMRRTVLPALVPIRTLYSFIPAMVAAAGFKVVELPVRHHARTGGESSYGLGVFLWRPFVDMLGLCWFRSRVVPLKSITYTDSSKSKDRA